MELSLAIALALTVIVVGPQEAQRQPSPRRGHRAESLSRGREEQVGRWQRIDVKVDRSASPRRTEATDVARLSLC